MKEKERSIGRMGGQGFFWLVEQVICDFCQWAASLDPADCLELGGSALRVATLRSSYFSQSCAQSFGVWRTSHIEGPFFLRKSASSRRKDSTRSTWTERKKNARRARWNKLRAGVAQPPALLLSLKLMGSLSLDLPGRHWTFPHLPLLLHLLSRLVPIKARPNHPP